MNWLTGVNDADEVVGGHAVGHDTHGFVWHDGVVTDLGTLDGGDYSLATAINASGDIVSTSVARPTAIDDSGFAAGTTGLDTATATIPVRRGAIRVCPVSSSEGDDAGRSRAARTG